MSNDLHVTAILVTWQLRQYLKAEDPLRQHELGQESLHDCLAWARGEPPCAATQCYLCGLRVVFAECQRVLRDDGVMFVIIGDTFHNKSCCGIPQRLALALCADGWIWRNEIIWHKPSCMPEAVEDRCTRSHEQVLLFSKRPRYFWDGEAIREPHLPSSIARAERNAFGGKYLHNGGGQPQGKTHSLMFSSEHKLSPGGRHARDVWTIASESYPGAHYATFPQALATRCILASTPVAGCCPACRTPWERQVEHGVPNKLTTRGQQLWTAITGQRDSAGGLPYRETITTGFAPACSCDAGPSVPSLVLDPFAGAGTTMLAARALGRDSIGVELSAAYLALSRERLGLTALARWEGQAGPLVVDNHADLPLFAPMMEEG